jgi:hypothetical protein
MRVRRDNPLVRPCVAARAFGSSASSRDALDSEVAVAQRDRGGDLRLVRCAESRPEEDGDERSIVLEARRRSGTM